MQKFFNTAGPCKPDMHYMLPATARLPGLLPLIAQQSCFVIHAPRQTGKTTAMLELARQLTEAGQYAAVLVSMEVGAAFNHDPGAAEKAILGAWRNSAEIRLPKELCPPPWPETNDGNRIFTALRAWSESLSRPLVIFLDEIDALEDAALISVLRQLRDGYFNRPAAFPWSLALIGLRDVRDYKVASGGSGRLHTASPFNIKVRSFTMANFSAEDVVALYGQHTQETGQAIEPEACAHAFHLTQGQPWLVNALANVAVDELVTDRSQPITRAVIDQAKETLIARQDTHLDSLAEKLQEPRVRQVIEPMLAGRSLGITPADDRQYVIDLGLIRQAGGGGAVIANPIYHEIIPRVLAEGPRFSLPMIQPAWLAPDGSLAPEKLLDAFLAFWRRHGQPLLASAHYHEVAPHLVLMAFLHRVINGGGTLEREYAIGMGRMDLCLHYGAVTMAMELKVWRDNEKDPLTEGLEQLDSYLAGLSLDTGWLVIFDQRKGLPPIAERTSAEVATSPAGRLVTVIRG